MTNLRHYDHDGRARFITASTHRRLPLFTDPATCEIMVGKLMTCCRADQVRLLAYCIMPEHFHFVGIPPLDLKFGPFVGKIKLLTSIKIHDYYLASGSEWLPQLFVNRDREKRFAFCTRRCFDFNCRTDDQVREKINYCHINPVRRKLVASPDIWKWSSYKYHQVELDNSEEFDITRMIRD